MLKWITYGADGGALPERVRSAIRDQQDRSEMLIGWFQLGVLVLIGSLYFAAPKTFSEDAEFAPVPWALAIYLVLTLIRLVWAHRGRLPDWQQTAWYVQAVIDRYQHYRLDIEARRKRER